MNPRVLGGVLLLSAVSLLSIGRLFRDVSDFYPKAPQPDGVTEFTGRFTALRAMLPDRGVIGYLTDPGAYKRDSGAKAEFYLIQYAVAPVIVVESPDQRYVIANFHQPVTTGALRDRGYKLVREFGSGVALLENEKAK